MCQQIINCQFIYGMLLSALWLIFPYPILQVKYMFAMIYWPLDSFSLSLGAFIHFNFLWICVIVEWPANVTLQLAHISLFVYYPEKYPRKRSWWVATFKCYCISISHLPTCLFSREVSRDKEVDGPRPANVTEQLSHISLFVLSSRKVSRDEEVDRPRPSSVTVQLSHISQLLFVYLPEKFPEMKKLIGGLSKPAKVTTIISHFPVFLSFREVPWDEEVD